MFPIHRTDNISIPSKFNKKQIIFDAHYPLDHKPKPVILFVHGFKGFKDWGHFNLLARYFANDGFVFIKANLSHNGTTPESPLVFKDLEAFGKNNFTIELSDIEAITDYLFSGASAIPESEMNLDHFFILGHSRGGGLALIKASEESRIKGVATWASMGLFEKLWKTIDIQEWQQKGVHYIQNSRTGQSMPVFYQLFEDWDSNKERLNIKEAVWHLTKPCLIIHGMDDESVPASVAFELHERNPETELLVIENANHTFGGYHPYDKNELPEHSLLIAQKTAAFFHKAVQQ
jgi:uncharacterized protein